MCCQYPESNSVVFLHTESLLAAVRATQESVGDRVTFMWIRLPRFQVDDEESKKRAEEKVWDVKKIAGPDVFCMIVQESSPVLSTWSFEANQLHMLLHGPFTYSNIQLEEFSSDALSSEDGGYLPPSPSLRQSFRARAAALSNAPSICASRTNGRAHDESRGGSPAGQ
jgi:hypothetical protein